MIEDGAFIGSDTKLVAPVRIGKDATTGAGSTISQGSAGRQAHADARQADDHRGLEAPAEEAQVVSGVRRAAPGLEGFPIVVAHLFGPVEADTHAVVARFIAERNLELHQPAGFRIRPPGAGLARETCATDRVTPCPLAEAPLPARRMSVSLPRVRPRRVDRRTRNPCARSGKSASGFRRWGITSVSPVKSKSKLCHGKCVSGTGTGFSDMVDAPASSTSRLARGSGAAPRTRCEHTDERAEKRDRRAARRPVWPRRRPGPISAPRPDHGCGDE